VYGVQPPADPCRWTDRALLDPGLNGSFANWGTMAVGEQLYTEPNNLGLQENCAVANFSQATGVPAMAGWSDAQCSAAAVYICKQQRESPGPHQRCCLLACF
jgi:hypothetical protein